MHRVKVLLRVDPPDVEDALFHCQQAVEKAFKAFLTWHDVPFRKIHELDVIGGQCADLDPTLGDLVDQADALTKYAWRFRYPGAPYQPALEEGREAHVVAREAYQAVRSRLPGDVQP